MSLIDLDSAARSITSGLSTSLIPVVDEAISKATTQLVPALGVQLRAGIQDAVTGLNKDSKEAIETLAAKVDDLVPQLKTAIQEVGEDLISKFFSELRATLAGMGGGSR